MMSYDKYSVLISLYEKENPDYFLMSINSILDQSVTPDEIIIVLDGKLNDRLYKIIDYLKSTTSIVKILELKENIGLGLALNEGLKVCANNLVARMDTDDISDKYRMEKQLKLFSIKKDIDIVGSYAAEFLNDETNILSIRSVPILHEDIKKFSRKRSPFNHPSVMYKKDSIMRIGGYSDLRRNQDVELFGRAMFLGLKGENIPESLLLYRINDSLYSRRKSWDNTKTYIHTIKRLWKLGHSSYLDYLIVLIVQLMLYILPNKVSKLFYSKILRRQK